MSFDPLSAAFDLGSTVIEKIWPDPTKQSEELRKLEELRQNGDLAELNAYVKGMMGQLSINATEAAHPSIFVAGWRPAIGWFGAFSLGYAGLIHPLLLWLWTVVGAFVTIPAGLEPPPYVEPALLGTIITGMLGVGGMRSFDKKNRVDSKGISRSP